MTIRTRAGAVLLTVRVERAFFGQWQIDTNATPREIDRRDRQTLGLWFVHVLAGPYALWLSGDTRHP